jgi:uncharacterized protein
MAYDHEIPLGELSIDSRQYAAAGAAILGIRDSGKTYTGGFIAEHLMDASVPITVLDPIGVWRWLKVPADRAPSKGYPVVVAGGEHGDLPLTPKAAPEIMRAAMQAGVSIVFDLYDMHLSKADWKRIVMEVVKVMLYENKAHRLRHIFIEEAAEFCPQILPKDGVTGQVYDVIERLARMGGNAKLGYTLINQRAEQVNKAVLELCDYLLLHRQKGKNSLASLEKWLQFADKASAAKITAALPTLPTGECYVWPAHAERPTHAKIGRKRTLHPDRRAAASQWAEAKAVDVKGFVKEMQGAIASIIEQAEENDPVKLKARVKELERDIARGVAAKIIDQPDAAALEAASREGYTLGYEEGRSYVINQVRAIPGMETALGEIVAAVAALQRSSNALNRLGVKEPPKPETKTQVVMRKLNPEEKKLLTQQQPGNIMKIVNGVEKLPGDGAGLPPSEQKILSALLWWQSHGWNEPSKPQVAALAGYSPNGGRFMNLLGALRTAGLIDYPTPGQVSLTAAGEDAAPYPDWDQHEAVQDRVRKILGPSEIKLFDNLVEARGDAVSRDELAKASGYEPKGGRFMNLLGRLHNTLEIITYPKPGTVALADWVR